MDVKEINKKGYKGNTNAQKGETKATAHINIRCEPSDKEKWTQKAKDEGIKLTEWIVKKLNERGQDHEN